MWSADRLSGMPDEELVSRSRDGDDHALDVVLRRHAPLVRATARGYFLIGADRDDLVQEGMIGLYKAVCEFDDGHRVGFASYARVCVERHILSAVRTATRHKHGPLNDYVSLHRPLLVDEDGVRTLGDVLPTAPSSDPLEQLVAAERLRHLRRYTHRALSELEAEVLRMHVGGAGYRTIARTLQRPAKTIDNALQRVRRKLEKHLAAWDTGLA